MPNNTWNVDDVDFLFEHYSTMSNKELSISLNKKVNTIKEYARRKGLFKTYDFYQNRRIGNFSNLLNETSEAYYWIGFIFADGTLSKDGRLSITTSWDNEHLEKFAKFINGKVTTNKKAKSAKNYSGSREIFYRVSVADTNRYKELFNKFNINNRKTYIPSDLKFLDADWKFYSFLIGFIDGDGNVTNDSIQIVNHISWNITHNHIHLWLKTHNIKSSVNTDSNGDSILRISRVFYRLMKVFINNNKIPAMDRKWNKNIIL